MNFFEKRVSFRLNSVNLYSHSFNLINFLSASLLEYHLLVIKYLDNHRFDILRCFFVLLLVLPHHVMELLTQNRFYNHTLYLLDIDLIALYHS